MGRTRIVGARRRPVTVLALAVRCWELPRVGQGRNTTAWHLVRHPRWNEGRNDELRRNPGWRMSLCSMIWEIVEFAYGRPTCRCCQRIAAARRTSG